MTKDSYTIVLDWSEEDQCFLVHFPQYPEQHYCTHGETRAEALANAAEVIELFEEEKAEEASASDA